MHEQYCEAIECESGEQIEWLLERLKSEYVRRDIIADVEEYRVIVRSEGGDDGDINGVAKAVAEFQKHFKIKTAWVGSYRLVCDGPSMGQSYGGAVVVRLGKEYWSTVTDLGRAGRNRVN